MTFIQQTGMQVISGGQTGVDLAALRAAQVLGFRTGGAAPLGWRTAFGPRPSLSMFGLHQSKSGYAGRTEENVVTADATLMVYVNGESPGEKLTRQLCKQHERPHLEVDLTKPVSVADIVRWIEVQGEKASLITGGFILNIAGNSSATVPGIFAASFGLLLRVLNPLISGPSEQDDIERAEVFAQFCNPQVIAMLDDKYDYVPNIDFRNKLAGAAINGIVKDIS